jgi:hypothetical protein
MNVQVHFEEPLEKLSCHMLVFGVELKESGDETYCFATIFRRGSGVGLQKKGCEAKEVSYE